MKISLLQNEIILNQRDFSNLNKSNFIWKRFKTIDQVYWKDDINLNSKPYICMVFNLLNL